MDIAGSPDGGGTSVKPAGISKSDAGTVVSLTFVTVEGGPHNVAWTHPEVVNPALLDFLTA